MSERIARRRKRFISNGHKFHKLLQQLRLFFQFFRSLKTQGNNLWGKAPLVNRSIQLKFFRILRCFKRYPLREASESRHVKPETLFAVAGNELVEEDNIFVILDNTSHVTWNMSGLISYFYFRLVSLWRNLRNTKLCSHLMLKSYSAVKDRVKGDRLPRYTP